MYKDILLKLIHKVYRRDPWIQELFKSAGITLENLEEIIEEINDQYFFDTATDLGLDIYEKELGLSSGGTIEDRRAKVEAAWKNGNKVDIYQLQAVADSWKNGETEITFINGKINIKFIGDYGVPTDLESLKTAIENTKPAHLAVIYAFKYLLIKDIHEVLTINQMQQLKLNQFAGGKDGKLHRKTRAV